MQVPKTQDIQDQVTNVKIIIGKKNVLYTFTNNLHSVYTLQYNKIIIKRVDSSFCIQYGYRFLNK